MRTYWPATFWLGLTALLALSVQRRLPRGFELASSRAPGWLGDGYAALEDTLGGLPGLGRLLTFDRLLRRAGGPSREQLILIFSLTALLGLIVLTGSAWGGLLTVVLLQLAWWVRCVVGAGRIAHLPIPRDRVFRHAVAPSLALLAATALADMAGWFEPEPHWPGLLVLWAFTWWQLLALFVSPRAQPWRERVGRLVAVGSYLLVVTGVALRAEQRAWVADLLARQAPDLLWLAAALAWLIGVLALRAAFLRADSAPSPPEVSS